VPSSTASRRHSRGGALRVRDRRGSRVTPRADRGSARNGDVLIPFGGAPLPKQRRPCRAEPRCYAVIGLSGSMPVSNSGQPGCSRSAGPPAGITCSCMLPNRPSGWLQRGKVPATAAATGAITRAFSVRFKTRLHLDR
jgi:hypothetical protein